MVAAGNYFETVDLSGQGSFGDGRVPHEDVVGGVAIFVSRDAKATGRVGLWVTIDEQAGQSFESQCRGEVDGGRGFPDPTFLIDDRDYFAHA